MTRAIEFVVPGDPVGKGRPRFARVGTKGMRAYTPAETKAAEHRFGYAARAALAGREPLNGAVRVEIVALCRVPKSWTNKHRAEALLGLRLPTNKPDIDNVAKLVLDGLNGVAFDDDAQIVEMSASKMYDIEPGVAVRITQMGATA